MLTGTVQAEHSKEKSPSRKSNKLTTVCFIEVTGIVWVSVVEPDLVLNIGQRLRATGKIPRVLDHVNALVVQDPLRAQRSKQAYSS
jgi:hypothetical protein